ncbi:MAG: murein biosynthesis integral membrane protein MurJ [Lentisphaeria bacterium]
MRYQNRKMGRRMLLVSGGILLSKCLGLARDMVFAYVWGTSTVLAAFILAFTVPNLLRALFGEGAFNAAFVPLFNDKLETESRQSAWDFSSRILTSTALVLVLITAALVGGTLLIRPFAPNELSRLTLELLPWLLPYGILICLTAGVASMLNSIGRFGVPAYAQALLNVCLIAAALGLAPLFGVKDDRQIYALVIAVLGAGLLQLAVNAWACRRSGWRYRLPAKLRSPEVTRFTALLTPILIGTGVVQLNVLVDRILAGYLGEIATTTLYYSQRLVYLPVGLFGVAMGTVCLPAMSRAWANRDREGVAESLRFSLEQVLFLAVPAAVALGILRVPIIRLLFERGDFSAAGTSETAWTLMFYIGGIPAFAAAKIATTPFHARQDTRTPVKVAAFCLSINVILNLILMQFIRQGGLALSTAVASWINVLMLLYFARSSIGNLGLRFVLSPVAKITGAAALAGLSMHFCLRGVDILALSGFTGKFMACAIPLVAGGVIYVIATLLLGCSHIKQILGRG